MSHAPVNVKLAVPRYGGWAANEVAWRDLNEAVGGHPGFYPLTVKAAYVVGVIHDICEAVHVLLRSGRPRHTVEIPAFGMFAGAFDLLGRCVNGNTATSGSTRDLKTGLRWLVSSTYKGVPDSAEVVTTAAGPYSINRLVALRHYAAHGQATSSSPLQTIDTGLLGKLRPRLTDGLERYWNALQQADNLCDALACANVIAFRNWPVFKSWALFQGDSATGPKTITEAFAGFDWT